MKVGRATREYEAWLGHHLRIVPDHLRQKHRNMASDPFVFLRATIYRWAQTWPEVGRDRANGPVVLSVGDLHIENFGTWRDRAGRLIWGVNDFDEACFLPYANDLVRLATSADLAIARSHLSLRSADACTAILAGYRKGLTTGGRPFVLEEEHPELREMAHGVQRDPARFWQMLDVQGRATDRSRVPPGALAALERVMPESGLRYRIVRRQAGQGSLGRQRFVALADWRGGRIALEAKALAPSAWTWATPRAQGAHAVLYREFLSRAVRCSDPLVSVENNWVVRRLAPDCSRIELSALPQARDERLLLASMGFELANLHWATPAAVKAILRDLRARGGGWLLLAAKAMTKSTRKDWKDWRERMREST